MDTNRFFDVIIIGAGAAGIMAALSVNENHPKKTLAIVEGSFAIGRKLLVSGGGRCNLYNINIQNSPAKYYFNKNKNLIESIFSQFGFNEIKDFFNSKGIITYIESKGNLGKVFPVTDQAKNIVELFNADLKSKGINIFLNCKIKKIKKTDDNKFVLYSEDKGSFTCDKLILAAGGKTYPALGSDGSGFELAKSFGHKVNTPTPAAVGLCFKDQICQLLQGVKFNGKVKVGGEISETSSGDILITKYGISGSAVLNISRGISILLNRSRMNSISISLNFTNMEREVVSAFLTLLVKNNFKIPFPYALYGLVHYKIANFITKRIKLENKIIREVNSEEINNLIEIITNYRVNITGTRSWNEAEFTSGGIECSEVDSNTLESKLTSGLYFCGEVVDIDGQIGGYNLSWAWASGAVAGKLK